MKEIWSIIPSALYRSIYHSYEQVSFSVKPETDEDLRQQSVLYNNYTFS